MTILGDKPLPKLIDFGVAKATSQRLTEKTVYTELGQLIGTPEYMSPEQAEMTGLDIDTRTDVYSLGVLLYELLVGVPPFDPEALRKGSFDEIIRRIREDEPPRPSTRLRTLGAEASSATSKRRRVDLLVLERQLKGDLDWITMKAMDKDRTRRYGSAAELAAAVARYLRQEPVVARPAGTAYRMGKFVRRHKVGVAAAVLVILAIVAGGIAATVGFVRATRAEQQARQEAERANQEAETAKQVSDFLVDLFRVSDPSEARGNTITAREILDRGAERIEQELEDQPLVRARLMHTIGDIYSRLGLYEEAESLLSQSLEIRESLLGEFHRDVEWSLYNLAVLYHKLGRYEEAEQFQRRVLAIREKLLVPEHIALVDSIDSLASLLSLQGKYEEAEPMYKRALAIAEQRSEDAPAEDGVQTWGMDGIAVGIILTNLGGNCTYQGRYEEAESHHRRSLEILEKNFGGDHPVIAYNRALALLLEAVGEEHLYTAASLHGLANLCRDQTRYDEAEPFYQRALAVREKLQGPNHPQVIETLEDYAAFLKKAGRENEVAEIDSHKKW